VAGPGKKCQQILDGGLSLDADHFRPRDHGLVDLAVAKKKDFLQASALLRFDGTAFLAFSHDQL